MTGRSLLILDCSDDCLRGLSDIAPRYFGSLHFLHDRLDLLRLASHFQAPVIVLPLVDDRGTPTLLLLQQLLQRSPSARVALFVRARSAKGSHVAEAVRAGVAEVLIAGDDWTAAFARLRQRTGPRLRRS
jgi:hypothetical protein